MVSHSLSQAKANRFREMFERSARQGYQGFVISMQSFQYCSTPKAPNISDTLYGYSWSHRPYISQGQCRRLYVCRWVKSLDDDYFGSGVRFNHSNVEYNLSYPLVIAPMKSVSRSRRAYFRNIRALTGFCIYISVGMT